MAVNPTKVYDWELDIWEDLQGGRVVLAPVGVGMDRRTGKPIAGWKHVVQSIQTIFATRYHERVLRRWVGSFVPHLLGENAVLRVITRFYWAMATAIDLWEPRYRILRIYVKTRPTDETLLTSAEELRLGKFTTINQGVYRPRGHLGDETPDQRKHLALIGRGFGVWEQAPL